MVESIVLNRTTSECIGCQCFEHGNAVEIFSSFFVRNNCVEQRRNAILLNENIFQMVQRPQQFRQQTVPPQFEQVIGYELLYYFTRCIVLGISQKLQIICLPKFRTKKCVDIVTLPILMLPIKCISPPLQHVGVLRLFCDNPASVVTAQQWPATVSLRSYQRYFWFAISVDFSSTLLVAYVI